MTTFTSPEIHEILVPVKSGRGTCQLSLSVVVIAFIENDVIWLFAVKHGQDV